jgi:hypothetical protein
VNWQYGITTCTDRLQGTLTRTLASLVLAGFDKPRLFCDGPVTTEAAKSLGLEITIHNPPIKTFGNWITALWELYLRDPDADRYAIFQDDVVAVKNLRAYLDRYTIADKSFWNLYTHEFSEKKLKGKLGWNKPARIGLGGLGFVFDRDGVAALLSSERIAKRPQWKPNGSSGKRWWKSLDGQVSDALLRVGYTELVHSPSLLQHADKNSSSIGNDVEGRISSTFQGEDFDAETLPVIPWLSGTLSPSEVAIANRRPYDGAMGFAGPVGRGERGRLESALMTSGIISARMKTSSRQARDEIDAFVSSVDTIIFFDHPPITGILESARLAGTKSICVTRLGPIGPSQWTKLVDRFIVTDKRQAQRPKARLPVVFGTIPMSPSDAEAFRALCRFDSIAPHS